MTDVDTNKYQIWSKETDEDEKIKIQLLAIAENKGCAIMIQEALIQCYRGWVNKEFIISIDYPLKKD